MYSGFSIGNYRFNVVPIDVVPLDNVDAQRERVLTRLNAERSVRKLPRKERFCFFGNIVPTRQSRPKSKSTVRVSFTGRIGGSISVNRALGVFGRLDVNTRD